MLNIIVEASVSEKLAQNLHTLDAQKPACLTDTPRHRRSIFVKQPGFSSLEYQLDIHPDLKVRGFPNLTI
jgi:hypothetical protein